MTDSADPAAFFVYGTLKRGECRERCWPRPPTVIFAATISAELYDLGPYPAILPGNDAVAGEIWRFAAKDMAETLRILDEIEGFRGEPRDLYTRRIVNARDGEGREIRAWSYFYARENGCSPPRRVLADIDGVCRWSG